jgi:hypothetical protein
MALTMNLFWSLILSRTIPATMAPTLPGAHNGQGPFSGGYSYRARVLHDDSRAGRAPRSG